MFVKARELKASMYFCNMFKNSGFNQFSSGQHYQIARGHFCNISCNKFLILFMIPSHLH